MRRQAQEDPTTGGPDALVVLGCRVKEGKPGGALLRRLSHAKQLSLEAPGLPIIMSGGRIWQGFAEADVMGEWWAQEGLDSSQVLKERESLNTKENAKRVALLCKQLRYHHLILITCDFHMPRARRLFLREALLVSEAPAYHPRKLGERLRLRAREWGARALDTWSERGQ